MIYTRFSKDLGMAVLKSTAKVMFVEPHRVNHIWIYDRSGSMRPLLRDLVIDMCDKLNDIENGDTISIGWFSGVGDFRFIVKGAVINGINDRKRIANIILLNADTRNTTCFSEILDDASIVIKELGTDGGPYSLMFFTDGYPVVPNFKYEIDRIAVALDKMRGKIETALLVGYGWNYNKQLMSDMTERIGGTLLHSSELKEFAIPFQSLVRGSSFSAPVKTIETGFERDTIACAFYLMDYKRSIVVATVLDNGNIVVPELVSEAYVIFSCDMKKLGNISLQDNIMLERVDAQEYLEACYAGAMILSQKMQSDRALQVLSAIGDVFFIDMLYDCFTNDEFGKVESQILECLGDASKRYQSGKKMNYVPSDTRFCLIDAIEILKNDPDAFFYPYHSSFEYSRIGVKNKNADDMPKFKHEEDARSSVSMFTWNDKRLNLSILAKINGTVPLGDECATFGFSKEYPTFVYRNYTIVKDGNLNMRSIPVSCSERSFVLLKKRGLIAHKENWYSDEVYKLSLSRIPIVNRSYSSVVPTAVEYCKFIYTEKYYEALLKVLKFILEGLEQEKENLSELLTKEQSEYLEKFFITKSGFSPKTVEEPQIDYYMARTFEVKMTGFSSLPKVQDVIDKIKTGKALTPAYAMMAGHITDLYNNTISKNDIRALIVDARQALYKVRNELQFTRFTVLLCKKWFPDLNVRDGAELELNGIKYTFSIGEVKVAY